jgi:predicted hotdog family 3-hydroxylacyl-ACP dehydratase
VSQRIEVRSEWPAFAGHFPGRPILPGIAHLALVRDALRRSGDPSVEILAVSQVRFRQVVEPGNVLDLVLDRRADGEVLFELLLDGRVASRGGITVGRAPAHPHGPGVGADLSGPKAQGAGRIGAAETFPPAVELVPHQGPALLLDRVVAASDDGLEALVVVPRESAFVHAGAAESFVAIEAAAQTAAAHEVLRRRRVSGTAEPQSGFLVGARDVTLGRVLPVDGAIEVAIRVDGVAPPLSTYRFQVSIEGAPAGSGSISTYLV